MQPNEVGWSATQFSMNVLHSNISVGTTILSYRDAWGENTH